MRNKNKKRIKNIKRTKRTGVNTKCRNDVKKVLWITALFALAGFYSNHFNPVYGSINDFTQNNVLPQSQDRIIGIKEKITIEAQKHNIDIDEALNIAHCESRHNPKAKSNISTASGLYQFINGTWKNHCKGDVFNEDDNIACFMKLYPKYPQWWECAYILGYVI
jgi:hypothetical protein